MAADIRTVSHNASMGFPETGLGIIPGLGGGVNLLKGEHTTYLRRQHTFNALQGRASSGKLSITRTYACSRFPISGCAFVGLVHRSCIDKLCELCCSCAGTQRTLRLIGVPRTKLLLFTGRRLRGDEAVSWGLADMLAENPEEVKAFMRLV